MPLLQDIQAELLDAKAPIGPILLKLRYLAAKLGSDVLEDWVRYETEGYPKEVEVPDYRKAAVTYRGTFTDGFRTVNDVPIPEYIVKKEAGEGWLSIPLRESIAVIDSLLATERTGDGKFGVAAGNLIPLLHGKVYEGMGAITIQSTFAGALFGHIHNMVRAKMLDLTIQLEKSVPIAALIDLGKPVNSPASDIGAQTTNITHTVVYGNQTTITNSAPGGSIQMSVVAGDHSSLARYLVEQGVPENEAQALAKIASEDKPITPDQPLSARAKEWLGKVAGGTWGVTKEVGTQILIEALKKYYGLEG